MATPETFTHSAATPGEARVIRSASVEGLLRAFSYAEGSAEWREALAAAGAGAHLPEQVRVEGFRALLLHLARRHFSGRPEHEAVRAVGAQLFHGYRKTLLGQVVFAALKAMGPDRMVRNGPQYIGRNTNFGERTARMLAPRHWELEMRGVPLPTAYYVGLFEEALRTVGAEHPEVTAKQTGPEDALYTLRW